ncbi:hypothetical protein BDA99DRAFT_184447 [Phascolomyces articulosus]|uniref:Uncharacterized protein n=1 Tax=Phascolomyces articulosus TaxID=60185 RepID=A0AAD5PA32_9FUNG|nr:hypothetical protein BDA99DRAFT_184447 [Phascolomyces articulosus]
MNQVHFTLFIVLGKEEREKKKIRLLNSLAFDHLHCQRFFIDREYNSVTINKNTCMSIVIWTWYKFFFSISTIPLSVFYGNLKQNNIFIPIDSITNRHHVTHGNELEVLTRSHSIFYIIQHSLFFLHFINMVRALGRYSRRTTKE